MLKTGVYPKSKARLGKVYLDFIANLESNTGSVTSFLGVARSESADGSKKTKFLVMESYQRHANKVLQRICTETKKKFKLNDIRIVHAIGKFRPGEPVVLVVVSSPRRGSSFLALREAVERYKKEPALFKQEIYEDGSSAWIT